MRRTQLGMETQWAYTLREVPTLDYYELIRKRRMCRSFTGEKLDPEQTARILDAAVRGPSAGFTQGFEFLVLELKEDLELFWDLATTQDWRERTHTHRDLWKASLVVIPLANRNAYFERYSEPDKSYSNLSDPTNWPAPYWYIDAAFATMLILLAVENEGLGALFFGLFREQERIKMTFSVPGDLDLVGAIAIGHRADDANAGTKQRARRNFEDQIHFGRFSNDQAANTATFEP